MAGVNRGERLQIMLTAAELEVLDDWRFKTRMPSRASAVRELLKRGLEAEGFQTSDARARSKDFAVTGAQTPKSGRPSRTGSKRANGQDGSEGHDAAE